LEQLSGLKGSIEAIQQKLEKGRLKLQSDFDIWYHQVVGDKENQVDYTEEILVTVYDQGREAGLATERQDVPSSSSSAVDDTKEETLIMQQSATIESKNEFKLPDGIKLTGNPEADADIIAFYKAKEVLLSKMKRKG
jgi:hypothetical protein